LASHAALNLGYQVFGEAQVMKGLVQGLGGLLRPAAVTLQALPHSAAAALSGFGLLFDVSLSGRHGVTPSFRAGFCGSSRPKRMRHMPLASVSVECLLRHVPPGLPTFFWQLCAV
jgi:hypothetical protein